MADTLFFIHANEQDPQVLADAYQLRGFDIVVSDPHAVDALDRMAEASPVAAVLCLDGDCGADVCAFAQKALADERTMRPLMVFVGGTPEDVAAARIVAPYGIFVGPDELAWVLKRLVIKL